MEAHALVDAAPAAFAGGLERVLAQPTLIRPVFQPIVELRRGVVAGYEALARFGTEPLAPPDHWFAAARAHGVADDLEAAVLSVVLDARHRLPANRFLSVNADPAALAAGPVQHVLASTDDLAGVVVELNEHEPVRDELLHFALDAWRARGARIAMHADATGYAALARLLDLRPDVLKVSRTVTAGIDGDEAKRAMVELATALAGRLDAWLVAEGIERAEELDALVALDVPLGQGWAIGRPGAEWQPCDTDAGERIRAAVARRTGTGLVAVAELRPTVPAGPLAGEEAAALFRAEPALDLVVAVDELGRPRELHVRTLGVVEEPMLLVVDIGAPPPEAARRAVARPSSVRFAPLLCTDGAGRFVGVVAFDRLVGWLAAGADV